MNRYLLRIMSTSCTGAHSVFYDLGTEESLKADHSVQFQWPVRQRTHPKNNKSFHSQHPSFSLRTISALITVVRLPVFKDANVSGNNGVEEGAQEKGSGSYPTTNRWISVSFL